MKAYLLRISAWLSQGINCILLLGHHDMTVSARCYVEYQIKGDTRWKVPHDTINFVFYLIFDQRDHCLASFLEDVAFAEEVSAWTGN